MLTTELGPIGKTPEYALARWVNESVYYGSRIRCRDMASNRKAELYDSNVQWLVRALSGLDTMDAPSQWVPLYWQNPDNEIPTPVFNEGLAIRTNESARLARPNYKPSSRPRSESPSLENILAAKKAKELVHHRLDDMGWFDHGAPLMAYVLPLHGGAWIKSEWVMTWDKTVVIPVDGAVRCPECDFTSAAKKIPGELAQGQPWAGNALSAPQDRLSSSQTVTLRACPTCPTHPPMLPLKPTMEEARTQQDSLGQPLGKRVPMGDWEMSVRSDYDVFPRNMGLDMQPGEVEEWTEVHVESLEWCALRWPDKMEGVEPERAATLAKYHPVAGAPDLARDGLEGKMFENCIRVKERHKEPWLELKRDQSGKLTWEMNKGRSVVVLGEDHVVVDQPFMIESLNKPGEWVERQTMDYIPWEFRDGGRRLRGISQWEIMFDAQDARNECRSQTQAVRQRMAVPLYVFFKDQNLEIVDMDGGIPGKIAMIEALPQLSGAQMPQVINNQTIDNGVADEDQGNIEFMQRAGRYVEVDKGQVPTGVHAAAAIKALKASSSEQREPVLNRTKGCLRRKWTHGAKLMAGLYIEPRQCRFEDEDGEERWEAFQGADLKGQTDIDIEGEPDFDKKARDEEIVSDLIEKGYFNPETDSPARKRKVLRAMDCPEPLLEEDDHQEEDAQREWIAFRDQKKPPYVDPELDDHSTHIDNHAASCRTPEFRELEQRADWDGALRILGDRWYEDLQAISFTPGPPCRQERILQYWRMKLTTPPVDPVSGMPLVGAIEPFQPPDPQALDEVMVWRAHMADHKLEDEAKQLRAQMGVELAAPGSPATAAGTQPTLGAPPAMPMAPQPAMVQ